MIDYAELDLLREALETLAQGYEDLPEFTPQFDHAAAREVLQLVATRMRDNYIDAPIGNDMQSTRRLMRQVFETTAREGLHLALIDLPGELVRKNLPGIEANAPTMTCLRSVLLQAEQRDWIDQIVSILESSLPP